MKVVICKCGNPYDVLAYDECPKCGEKPFLKDAQPQKKHWWQRLRSEEREIQSKNKQYVRVEKPSVLTGDEPTVGNYGDEPTVANYVDSPTEGCFEEGDTPTESAFVGSDALTESAYESDDTPTESIFIGGDVPTESIYIGETASVEGVLKESEEKSTSNIDYYSSGEDDTTIAFFQASGKKSEEVPTLAEGLTRLREQDDTPTEAILVGESQRNQKRHTEPVVGWLVAVKGLHIGEGFPLFAGRCSIGRGEQNKVVISGDKTISRDKHAWILYEPRKREFWLQPGTESGLTYHNDEIVMEKIKLNNRDKIEMGNSTFLFVPLCNETFSWEEYI